MAQKLHDQYGYNYDNLKVLLGGWNAWKAAGYPTEGGASAPAGGVGTAVGTPLPLNGGNGGVLQITPIKP